MFGGVKIAKNAESDKTSYPRYGTGFDSRSFFSFPGCAWGKNVFIFGVDNSLSMHTDNNKKLY